MLCPSGGGHRGPPVQDGRRQRLAQLAGLEGLVTQQELGLPENQWRVIQSPGTIDRRDEMTRIFAIVATILLTALASFAQGNPQRTGRFPGEQAQQTQQPQQSEQGQQQRRAPLPEEK